MSRGSRMALAAGLLAIVGALFHRELGWFIRPDPAVVLDVRGDISLLDDLSRWPADRGRFENRGFVPCASGPTAASGWCLAPGTSGTVRLILPDAPQAQGALMRLFFFSRDASATHRLLVFRESDPAPRLQFNDIHFADARLDLSSALARPGGALIVSFEGENPTEAPDVFLQSFDIRLIDQPVPQVPPVGRMGFAVLALGLCGLPFSPRRQWLPLWLILTAGFALRYYFLTQAYLLPLEWDAVGFRELAQKMRLFSSTGFYSAQFGMREPLFLLIVKTCLGLFGDSETHVRLVSFLASLAVIMLTYRLGARIFGRPWGLLAALAIALSLPLARESVRGLRLEVEMVLILLFLDAAFVARIVSPWRRAGLLGAIGGALSLVRTNYLFNLLPLIAVACGLRSRRGWLAGLLGLLIMAGIQAPHRWSMARLHGDPFWDTKAFVRIFSNVERAETAAPATRAAIWTDLGQGGGLSFQAYLFGQHTVPEVLIGTVRGTWKVIRHMDVVGFYRGVERLIGVNLQPFDLLFQIAGLAGLLLAAATPGKRWLPLAFIALLAHVVFFYDRGATEPWRHTYQAFPLFVLCGIMPVWAIARLLSGVAQSSLEPARVTS